jgi:hypothetical protein
MFAPPKTGVSMAFIEFDVRRPNIRFDASQYGEKRSWAVSFELYFAHLFRPTVRLTTEEKELRNLDGMAGFAVMDEHTPKDSKGYLYYSPAWEDPIMGHPAQYSVSLWLAADEMARLIDLVQSGVPLTKLSIDVEEGVKYGWEPDGSGTDWDNAQFQQVPVKGFNLKFGATDDAVLDDDVEPSKSILDDAAAPDTFKRDALAKLSELTKLMGWLVALVVFAAVLFIIRR